MAEKTTQNPETEPDIIKSSREVDDSEPVSPEAARGAIEFMADEIQELRKENVGLISKQDIIEDRLENLEMAVTGFLAIMGAEAMAVSSIAILRGDHSSSEMAGCVVARLRDVTNELRRRWGEDSE